VILFLMANTMLSGSQKQANLGIQKSGKRLNRNETVEIEAELGGRSAEWEEV
jgi:hypothetical protein